MVGTLKPAPAVSESSQMLTTYRAVHKYLHARSAAGELRPASVRTASTTLFCFARAVGDDLPVRQLSRRHVERWMEDWDVAQSTKRTGLSVVKSFTRWLAERELVVRDPAAAIRGPRLPRSVPRRLRLSAATAVVNACLDERERAVVVIMLQLGLRCGEVARLQLGDIDFIDATLTVTSGKGGHGRDLPLTDEARRAISGYLSAYPATAGPLIRSYVRPHEPLTPDYISTLVSKAFRRAGVKMAAFDGKSAHACRHTAACDLLKKPGTNLRDAQTMLGHASLATTSRYLGLSELGDLRKAMEGRSYIEIPLPVPASTGNDAA